MKKVIGITGGIATGKSQVSQYLRDKGYFLIDADEVVHKLQEPNGALNQAIYEIFGAEFFDDQRNLNRQKLGQLIFSGDKAANDKLNALTETIVSDEILRERDEATDDLVFMDIPLLFEQNYDKEVTETWLIYAPASLQLTRLMARNQLTKAEALARLAAQMQIEEKRTLSDLVIENTGTIKELQGKIDDQLTKLSKQA